MKLDVVGFGALNVDKFYHVTRIAREGEESSVLSMSEAPGGSAANTIVGLARLGARTGFIGKVADDREGHSLLDDFGREGVDTHGVIVSREGATGAVSAFIDEEGERALYVHPSVNDTLSYEEINLEYASQTDFLHLTSFHVKPFRAQVRLVENLRNVRISLDPGEIYARKGLTSLRSILKHCFVLLPSENEVKLITGKGWKQGAEQLLHEGARVIAVKLGEKGCYVTDGNQKHLILPHKARVVDTTGAGDAFCAGFLYGLIKKKDLYECGQLGNFVASKCIEKVGARTGLPTVRDLKDF